jgi:phosphoribosylformimino-5-aminoimidazole carboxamide ribonucleotide (ProFAR) isomerase
LLEKIDWKPKITRKAIVRAVGIAICIAGGAGKIASIITINPILNDISIKGAVTGAALAVGAEKAPKLLEKWIT